MLGAPDDGVVAEPDRGVVAADAPAPMLPTPKRGTALGRNGEGGSDRGGGRVVVVVDSG